MSDSSFHIACDEDELNNWYDLNDTNKPEDRRKTKNKKEKLGERRRGENERNEKKIKKN